MIQILQKASTWKYLLPLFVMLCGFYAIIFPYYQSQLSVIAGEEVKPLDVRFTYTLEEVTRDFGKLGEAGRNVYKVVVGRVDMIFPVVYGLFLMLLLVNLLKKTTKPGSRLMLIALLPALVMLFDYLENLNTLRLLENYPDLLPQAVARGEQMTRIKWLSLFLSLGLAFLLTASLLIKKLMQRKGKTGYNRE